MSLQESHYQGWDAQADGEYMKDPSDSQSDSNTDLNGESEQVGDNIATKKSTVMRFGLVNIQGILVSNNHPKNEHTRATTNGCEFGRIPKA